MKSASHIEKKYCDGKSDRNRDRLIEKWVPNLSFLGHTCTCKKLNLEQNIFQAT